jgi:hypothetical protein
MSWLVRTIAKLACAFIVFLKRIRHIFLVLRNTHRIGLRSSVVVLLVTTSACFSKNEIKLPTDVQMREVFRQHDVEYLLGDITLPIAAVVHAVEQGANYVMVRCYSQKSRQELVDFYVLDCERLGWNCISHFSCEKHVKFIFEKPHRMSILTLVDDEHGCCVEIYAGERVR